MECRPVSEPSLDVSLTSSQRVWCLSAPIRGRRFQAGSLGPRGQLQITLSPNLDITSGHGLLHSLDTVWRIQSRCSNGQVCTRTDYRRPHNGNAPPPPSMAGLAGRGRSIEIPREPQRSRQGWGTCCLCFRALARFEQHDNQQAAVTPWALSLPGVSGIRRDMIQSVRSGHKTQLAACSMPDARCRP